MADPITWVLRVQVNDGARDDFEALMKELVQNTSEETGTLVYDWFADGDMFHIVERYHDSEAVLTHLGHFGPYAERFLGTCQPTELTVYGDPSAAAREGLAGFGPTYLAPQASIGA